MTATPQTRPLCVRRGRTAGPGKREGSRAALPPLPRIVDGRGSGWPKWLTMGSKRAHFTCLGTPNGLGSFLEKHSFDPFLTHFWSWKNPFSRHFATLEGPKWLAMGSKWAHFTCLGTPNGLGSFVEKHIFDPFVTHFLSQKNPIFKAFWDFRKAKTGHHELKPHQKHLFWHHMWSRFIFEKSHFFCTRWTLLMHFGTHLLGLPLVACCSPLSLGTRV